MRLIIVLISSLLITTPALAITNETLYKWCKSFADLRFDLSNANDGMDLATGSYCLGYMQGLIEQSNHICIAFDGTVASSTNIARRMFGASVGPNDTNALIQSFINWAEDNPQKWPYKPLTTEWLQLKYPCKN